MATIDPTDAGWRTENPEGLRCCINFAELQFRKSGESERETVRE